MKYEAIRKTVLEAILEAVEKGLINGTSGNIAMRDSEDRNIVAITPSGISYTGMKPEDIAIVEGKKMEQMNGSMETINHLQKFQ